MGVNLTKKLQVYFISLHPNVFTSSHISEFSKNLYKFQLQAFTLYLQW